MLFVELRFLPFLLAVLAITWGLRRNGARKVFLLAASYVFYGAWDPRFLWLIIGSTLVDYVVGLRLVRPGAWRRGWLLLSLGVNLGLLGVFKYFHFFVDSALALGAQLGVELSRPTLEIVLPVGISFYTFQTLSYSLDIYFRRLRPTRNLLDLAVFVAFFPQLVAGPIVRAAEFLPQLKEPRRFDRVYVRGALVLFLVGFFKKACVSDNVAPFVDQYFADPELYGMAAAWKATLLYAVQIYCDFSGYSDMAIACAGLLGYRLTENFARPYLAANITEFWRRWHISLSSWLRDYLYIPLGGNRGSRLFTHRNLLLTMLLGGLWHGAAWTFVVWGGLHGLALIVHKELGGRLPRTGWGGRAVRLGAPLLTLWFVCLCWIFFRAQSFGDALLTARAFCLLGGAGDGVMGNVLFATLPVLLALHVVRPGLWEGVWRRVPGPVFGLGYGAVWALIVTLVPINPAPFIYFQF